jgi:hypothetical protein
MTDVEQVLAAELAELGDRAPHDPDLAGSVRRRARRQATVLATALAVLVLVAGGAVAAARLRPAAPAAAAPTAAPTVAPPTVPAGGCPQPRPGRLPEWARAGFGSPDPGLPMTYSDKGLVLAIVFGTPLTAPPTAGHNNKILWAAKVGGPGDFVIDAWPVNSPDSVVRINAGPAPGPSIVDLPRAGCWRMKLSWGGYTDMITLPYVAR